jgi:hypothetical protein
MSSDLLYGKESDVRREEDTLGLYASKFAEMHLLLYLLISGDSYPKYFKVLHMNCKVLFSEDIPPDDGLVRPKDVVVSI